MNRLNLSEQAADELDMFVFTNYNGTRGISSVYIAFYIYNWWLPRMLTG